MFRRLGNLIRGFFGLFVSGLEKDNPEALLEVEKENLREQIGQYNSGLASHAALCERLMGQVKRQEAETTKLRAKIQAHIKAGNREVAARHALRFKEIESELADNRRQLEDAEKTYKELVRARDVAIREAQNKIESLKRSISDLKVQKATAELSEMASGMISEIGGSGDTLDRLEKMVQEERDLAAGRARVARSGLDTTDFDIAETEQAALADAALADFAASEGIDLSGFGGAPAPAEPEASEPKSEKGKSMGPIAESE